MRAIQKILRQGNSAMVTVPRQLMATLGWLPGELVVLEVKPDGSLTIDAWKSRDVVQGQSPGVIHDAPSLVTR